MTIKTFEVGKTYATRSACDYECVFAFTVLARSAKQITIEDKHGNVSKRGVQLWDDAEMCFPQGRYSMAPVIRADREAV